MGPHGVMTHEAQVAMECAKAMGCNGSVVDFVMPLGTTVNMNGTALYEATTVIFLAQVCSQRMSRALSAQSACIKHALVNGKTTCLQPGSAVWSHSCPSKRNDPASRL